MSKSQKDDNQVASTCQGSVRAHDFSEIPWGTSSHDLTERCKGYSIGTWRLILDHASAYLSSKDREVMIGITKCSGNNADTVTKSLHACINLEW